MNQFNRKITLGGFALLMLALLPFGFQHKALAVGQSYPVSGQVSLNGQPANGANVILTNVRTGESMSTTTSPSAGSYYFDLSNLNSTTTDQDIINISATANSLSSSTSFIFNSQNASATVPMINIISAPASSTASISIQPQAPVTMEIGSTTTYTARITDQSGNEVSASTTWTSSVPSVASIDSRGTATALAEGTTTIVAMSGNLSASTTLYVNGGSRATSTLTSLSINPTSFSIAQGETMQLNVTASDQYGGPFSAALSWTSSNSNIATVSTSGLVTAVSSGTASITVSSGNSSASSTVTVKPAPIATSITVSPSSKTIRVGSTTRFTALIKDQDNQPFDAIASWFSSNPNIASVNTDGVATGLSLGTTTITALYQQGSSSIYASADLTVSSSAPIYTFLNISPVSTSVPIGSTIQFTSATLDQYGDSISASTTSWQSSNANVASISNDGLASALSAGTTTIIAVNDGIASSIDLTVTAASTTEENGTTTVTGIAISPANPTAYIGTPISFSIKDQNSNNVSSTTFWEKSGNIGSISSTTGLFTPSATGTGIITARLGNLIATTTITVDLDTTPPTTPADFTVTVISPNDVRLSWSSSTDNVGVIGYRVSRDDMQNLSSSTASTVFDDKGVIATTISYSVSAYDAAGNYSVPAKASATAQNNKPVIPIIINRGGGGGFVTGPYRVKEKESIDSDLELDYNQSGHGKYNFNKNGVEFNIDNETVKTPTKFNAMVNHATADGLNANMGKSSLLNGMIFKISAKDANGGALKRLEKEMIVNLSTAMPTDAKDHGVYFLDESSKQWILVPNSAFDTTNSRVSFKVNHLSSFGIIKSPGLPNVIQASAFLADESESTTTSESLARTKNGKVYLIRNNRRIPLSNEELKEYRREYPDLKINDIDDASLSKYKSAAGLKNGTLIKDKTTKKIYVIRNHKKMHILNLGELAKYKGKRINIVSDDTIKAY